MLKKIINIITLICLSFAGTVNADDVKRTPMAVLHKEKSLYHDVMVLQSKDRKCLAFLTQKKWQFEGCVFLNNPDIMVDDFTKLLLAGLYLNPYPQKILVIGLGIGTLPNAFTKLYSDVSVDTVEIDQSVFNMAKEYFNFEETDRSHVFIEDGRMYVKRAIKEGAQYDLVILDAFNGDYIPEHLLTKEFLEEVKKILTPAGVMATNTFSASGLYPNESATYEAVFGKFYNLKQNDGNRIIVAQKNGTLPLETVLANAVTVEEGLNHFGVSREWLFPYFGSERDWPSDARILTDQYSPANLLNAQKP